MQITWEEEEFATLHLASPRPFVYPLYGPGQVPMTRGYPVEAKPHESQDHPHHQSFWFAHGDVNGHDFWHAAKADARIEWDGAVSVEPCADGTSVTCGFRWMVGEDDLICEEERVYVFAAKEGVRTVDVSLRLAPVGRDLVMGDTKEGSFALRLHPALRVEGGTATGTLRNSDGLIGREAWGKRARWIRDFGTVEGASAGLAIFDHPNNPRHPTWWHARTYGLVAANPFGLHDFEGGPEGAGDLRVPLGDALVLRYRVLLHGPDWTDADIEAAYRNWVR